VPDGAGREGAFGGRAARNPDAEASSWAWRAAWPSRTNDSIATIATTTTTVATAKVVTASVPAATPWIVDSTNTGKLR